MKDGVILMWKDYIYSVSKEYLFKPPAANAELISISEELNVKVPQKLFKLLSETNGVFDCFGCPLIWSTAQIVRDNLFFRDLGANKDLYMPFDNLLFFSDNGCGDMFCYKLLNGSILAEDIYVWNHEDDSRLWVASSLEEFIRGWITGEITT
ncbi:SMI1/KNR4 family protein [Sporosarcina cyprini]|uniref:SMI1/KNR4 family protein n=1 Tax=Sporosarcina cyprini TaxID=2910523 RepID=UPI003AB96EA7